LSEGITLLTTTPSISPSLKDDRNQTPIEKGIKLQEPAATLVILETGALKLPTQLRGYWNTFTRIRARDPAEPDVLAVLEQAYSRTARALQITRKGKAAAGVGQLPGRDRPPANGQRNHQLHQPEAGEIARCNERTTQPAAGSSLANK